MLHEGQNLLLSNRELGELMIHLFQNGKALKFKAKGTSMAPVICEKDITTIAPLSWKSHLENGDMVAVISPNNKILMIHRIICKNNDLFLIKGDNLWHTDGYFEIKHIIGYIDNIKKTYSGSGLKNMIEKIFFFCSGYPKVISILSRYKIWTFFCRAANKIL